MNRDWLNVILLLLCLVSGYVTTQTQYDVRRLYVALAEQESRARALQSQFLNLGIEQDELSKQAVVQRRAATQLRMVAVDPRRSFYPGLMNPESSPLPLAAARP